MGVRADAHRQYSVMFSDGTANHHQTVMVNAPQSSHKLRIGLDGNHLRSERKKGLGVFPIVCADVEHEVSGRNVLPIEVAKPEHSPPVSSIKGPNVNAAQRAN